MKLTNLKGYLPLTQRPYEIIPKTTNNAIQLEVRLADQDGDLMHEELVFEFTGQYQSYDDAFRKVVSKLESNYKIKITE